MSKEMIISVNGREKKIAIVEDDVVTEFYVERGDENQGIVGNIYKGRVMKVLPGMQSAFVDIGLERDSFLYVSDFFDEEEEEEEVEEKRETGRQVQKQARAPREGLRIAPPVEQEPEEEKDFELRMAALRHIEEISAEPAIEPSPEEEGLEAGSAEAADEAEAPLSPRQRRQRRLRYADKEPKAEKAEKAPAAAEVREADAAAEGETEEEYSGRRRRRPRRRRGAEATESPEATEGATRGDRESSPYVIVHHEPLERVMDDDAAVVEGEMLKDALLQTRITERIREEERRSSLLEVEPTPEVLVGSLRRSIASELGFERVSDDSETRPGVGLDAEPNAQLDVDSDAEPGARPNFKPDFKLDVRPSEESDAEPGAAMDIEAGKIEPISQWAPTVYETLVEAPEEARPDFEPSEIDENIHEDILAIHPDATQNGDSAESPREAAPETPEEDGAKNTDTVDELRDAVAKIRQRPRRGEMATRRGGRGRRRGTGTYRTRAAAAAEPALGVEERRDEEAYEQEEPAPLARPALARAVDRFSRPVITDLLREGQEIIVQIAKEPIGQKGARITSHVALPGRYIVYMPTVDHIGVSRKIGTDEERQRLKRTLHQLRAELGAPGGFIVRTAANGCTIDELREDMSYLIRTWTDIRRRADRVKAPAIAHRDLDLVQRILRDQLSSDYSAIRVDSEFEYERIVDFVNRFAPKLVNRVKLYTKDTPILEHYGVQAEIDKAVKPRVWLKSGGYIVINQTEALVAIDVNTGKFVGKSNRLEDTIVKTNLEAAKEIVRQIRLRDLGGIIVLDFIDMEERKNRQKVMGALEQELRSDRSPSKILQFNDFGLVAITRKRVKQSLERTLCTPCPYCGGGGMVKSPQTVSYEILAEARRISKDVDHHNEVILRVNPEVAKALRGPERDVLAEIEAYLGGLVTIKSDPTVHQEQFDIALA
jgi:Rne/Rng family ribonuclease